VLRTLAPALPTVPFRLLAAAVMLTIGWMSLAAGARVFSGPGGTAYVVDAATGQGVAGAIVEASWVITNFRDPAATPLTEVLHAYALSDSSGRFTLPSWGPIDVDLYSPVRSVVKVLDYSQPHLYLYKPGYRLSLEQGPTKDPRARWVRFRFTANETRDPWWDQRVFKLAPDRATDEARRRELAETIAGFAGCRWVRLPRIAAAHINEGTHGPNSSAAATDAATKLLAETCPDARQPLAASSD